MTNPVNIQNFLSLIEDQVRVAMAPGQVCLVRRIGCVTVTSEGNHHVFYQQEEEGTPETYKLLPDIMK